MTSVRVLGLAFFAVGIGVSRLALCNPDQQEIMPADIGLQDRLVSNIESLTNYSRIRLRDYDELDRSYKLVERYLAQPELATTVTELVLDVPVQHWRGSRSCFGDEEKRDIEPLDEDNDRPLVSHLKSLGLGDESTKFMLDALAWKKDNDLTGPLVNHVGARLEGINDHANYALSAAIILISISPNIERVGISQFEPAMEEFLIRNNYGLLPQNYLQRLKHVNFLLDNGQLSLSDDRFFFSFDILRALRLFHRLPSVESLSVEGIGEHHDPRNLLVPHTSNLKRIHIKHSELSSDMLFQIIRLPKHDLLEEFRYSVGGRALLRGGYNLHISKSIGKALLTQKHSLVMLDLDLDSTLPMPTDGFPIKYFSEERLGEHELFYSERERDEYSLRDEEVVAERACWPAEVPDTRAYGTTIGSLHDFEVLTNLSIGVKLLLGFDRPTPFRLVEALPKSLKSLTLRGYTRGRWQEWDEQVKELMERRATVLPSLEEVNGVEEEIPSAEFVANPDENYEELWQPEEDTRGWEEAPPPGH